MSKDEIVKLKSQLNDLQRDVLKSEMEKHHKSTGTAYVLWFFFGTLGIHKFYIGKTGWGLVYLLLGIVGWISLIVGLASSATKVGMEVGAGGEMEPGIILAIISLSILGVLVFIDLFTIPSQIRKVYEKKEISIVNKLRAEAPSS